MAHSRAATVALAGTRAGPQDGAEAGTWDRGQARLWGPLQVPRLGVIIPDRRHLLQPPHRVHGRDPGQVLRDGAGRRPPRSSVIRL